MNPNRFLCQSCSCDCASDEFRANSGICSECRATGTSWKSCTSCSKCSRSISDRLKEMNMNHCNVCAEKILNEGYNKFCKENMQRAEAQLKEQNTYMRWLRPENENDQVDEDEIDCDNPAEICHDSDMNWYYNPVADFSPAESEQDHEFDKLLIEAQEQQLVIANREITEHHYQEYVLNNFLTTLDDLLFVARSGVREIKFPMNVEGDWDALMKLEKAGVRWRLDLFSDTFFVRF